MVERRGLLAIVLSLGGILGCASSRAALEVSREEPLHEVVVRDLPVEPHEARPATNRLGDDIVSQIAAPGPLDAATSTSSSPSGPRRSEVALVPEDWSRATRGRSEPELAAPALDEESLAVLQLGALVRLEFSAASEPQEVDTLGYWEEFHLGRTQDQFLDLTWTWRRGPDAALIGTIGAPRTLGRAIEDAILDPDLVFVALGLHFRW